MLHSSHTHIPQLLFVFVCFFFISFSIKWFFSIIFAVVWFAALCIVFHLLCRLDASSILIQFYPFVSWFLCFVTAFHFHIAQNCNCSFKQFSLWFMYTCELCTNGNQNITRGGSCCFFCCCFRCEQWRKRIESSKTMATKFLSLSLFTFFRPTQEIS